MKKINIILLGFALTFTSLVQAGNPDRIGEAGSTHLIINPWARSAGWAGAFTAGVSGLEAMRFNVAGMTNTSNNEVMFSRTTLFSGGQTYINSFGLKTSIGESSALSASIMSMDLGDFVRTTEDLPDGTLGTFSPSYTNIGLGYAYKFSDATSGGLVVRMISEAIPDLRANGIAIDAGIQYKAGREQRFKLGFSLRNIGPAIRYTGNGLDYRASDDEDPNATARLVKSRVATFELPSILNIGVAYDLYIGGIGSHNKITLAGNFLANSFGTDKIQIGAQYAYKEILMVRAGFNYEDGVTNSTDSRTLMSGPTAGATFQLPFGADKDKYFGIDYAYQNQYVFNGAHTIGAIISF